MTPGYVAGPFVNPNFEFSGSHASSDAHPTRFPLCHNQPFRNDLYQGFSTEARDPLWGPRSGSPETTRRSLY